MLTRKEELFVKPFQQRLYHQHKVKVSTTKKTYAISNTINYIYYLYNMLKVKIHFSITNYKTHFFYENYIIKSTYSFLNKICRHVGA